MLPVSEDLDELLELSDRIVVMFEGQVVHETTPAEADLTVIVRFMAGHWANPYSREKSVRPCDMEFDTASRRSDILARIA